MFTLWKGTDLLGEIHPRPATARQERSGCVSGVLLPVTRPVPVESMAQHEVELPDRRFTVQTPLPSDAVDDSGTVPRVRTDRSARVDVELRRHPPDEPFGVDADQQLRVVDTDGETIATRSIMVTEHSLHPQSPETQAIPAAAVDERERVWLVAYCRTEQTP